MIMLGVHKPQQQATLTKNIQIQEIFFHFHFRNPTEKIQILGFLFVFARNVSVRMVMTLKEEGKGTRSGCEASKGL